MLPLKQQDGEGNGTPLQYSCLENPMDGGAWKACSPWGRWGSGTTERLHFHFSLSCIGEGNGNPLQCSCLENPRGRRAWWAAVYGVAQSWTWLKRLSSGSQLLQVICWIVDLPPLIWNRCPLSSQNFHNLNGQRPFRQSPWCNHLINKWRQQDLPYPYIS